MAKFTYVALPNVAKKRNGAVFLRQAIVAFLYQIHSVLTDNGAAFTEQSRYRIDAINCFEEPIFDHVCKGRNNKLRLSSLAIHGLTYSRTNESNDNRGYG